MKISGKKWIFATWNVWAWSGFFRFNRNKLFEMESFELNNKYFIFSFILRWNFCDQHMDDVTRLCMIQLKWYIFKGVQFALFRNWIAIKWKFTCSVLSFRMKTFNFRTISNFVNKLNFVDCSWCIFGWNANFRR